MKISGLPRGGFVWLGL